MSLNVTWLIEKTFDRYSIGELTGQDELRRFGVKSIKVALSAEQTLDYLWKNQYKFEYLEFDLSDPSKEKFEKGNK